MIGFKDFQEQQLLSEQKNLHLTHIEETIITHGSQGATESVEFLKSIRNMLSSNVRSSTNITTKWDGAPAIFCGINPDNGKFFVATKSVFNKNPKLNYTVDDITANHSGGLVEKLKVALAELPKLGIKGVLQGDMMYTNSDLQTQTIDGEEMITFQPNTIVYAIPTNSELGQFVKKTNMGIIFHTEYKGKKLEDMKASFNINIKGLRKSRSIWFDDASYKDVSGTATLTEAETVELDGYITKIERGMGGISSYLDRMAGEFDEKSKFAVPTNFKIHLNSYFKSDKKFGKPESVIREFAKFYSEKLDKEIAKVKTEKSKDKYEEIKRDGLKRIKDQTPMLIQTVALYKDIMDAKNLLVNKLSQIKGIGTFLRTDDGLKVTAPEGFVAVDRVKGNAVKLVNRLEFSKANFTAQKNWVSG
jgi:hypothetical protein